MSLISIPVGVSTLGNSTDQDFDLAAISTSTDIKYFKTLVNGHWKSWVPGTPDVYQGFLMLNKGYGFVVNTVTQTSLDLGTTVLNVNNLQLQLGLALVSLPYANKDITSGGFLPRFSATYIKTIDTAWKSWTRGTPAAYQGFQTVSDTGGYVVNIDKVYNNYLDKSDKDRATGVMIGAVETIAANPNTSKITNLPNEFSIKSLTYTGAVSSSSPTKNMAIDIAGTTYTIAYPIELDGSDIVVVKNDVITIDLGSVNDTVGTVTDAGVVTDTTTPVTVDYGNIDAVTAVYTNEYTYTLAENANTATPTTPASSLTEDILEVMYDTITFDNTVAKKVMMINLDGNHTRLSFASEYTGNTFIVLLGAKYYTGVFTESSTYITL